MSADYRQEAAKEITVRNYYEGPSYALDDVSLRGRYFTDRANEQLVAGCDFSVTFCVRRAAKEVWPIFKDFNLWQSPHNHFYSGVVGDLEGESFGLGPSPNDLKPHRYKVVKVIPEYLIVISQPVPVAGTRDPHLPGLGGVSPGFHVFMLHENNGKTVVTALMEHASLVELVGHTQQMTDQVALNPWRDEKMVPDWLRKWRDAFIPSLKALVDEAS